MQKTNSFIWEIESSPYPSDFLQESMTFGSVNPVFLIDQYAGKRPTILNQQFLTNGTINVSMYPSALLDSNVLDLVDIFVQKRKSTDGFKECLRFLTKKGWDFSPLFYYLEHYAKSSLRDFRHNAIRRTESLLKLHSMDEKHFLETGEIIPNPQAVEHYTGCLGVDTLADVAEKRVEEFINGQSKYALAQMLEATEIALMKMVLIRKSEMTKSSPVEQYNEFERFLRNDVGVMLCREAHLSLHYFCDNAGKLLGIQANTTSYEKAVSIIKSTAWDIYLLRMPEIFFTESSDEACIAYIATQEKKLQELARLYTVNRIESYDDAGIYPLVGFNLTGIPESVKSELPTVIERTGQKGRINLPTGLHEALENELRRICA